MIQRPQRRHRLDLYVTHKGIALIVRHSVPSRSIPDAVPVVDILRTLVWLSAASQEAPVLSKRLSLHHLANC